MIIKGLKWLGRARLSRHFRVKPTDSNNLVKLQIRSWNCKFLSEDCRYLYNAAKEDVLVVLGDSKFAKDCAIFHRVELSLLNIISSALDKPHNFCIEIILNEVWFNTSAKTVEHQSMCTCFFCVQEFLWQPRVWKLAVCHLPASECT